jgi:hypothetical protein
MASSRFDVPHVGKINSYSGSNSDYVAYVNSEKACLEYGFVVSASEDNSVVIPHGQTETVEVPNNLVVAKVAGVDSNDFLSKKLSVEANLKDPDKLKEYYTKLYSYDPEYLKLVEQTIDKQASL